ncbi:MAG: hypothetical protein ACJ77N_10705, partial [Chloroflexota bacterium]
APTGDSAATSVAADAKGRARTPARDRATRDADVPATGQGVPGQQEAQPRRPGGESEAWVATGPGRPPAPAATAAAPIAGVPDAGESDSNLSVDPASPPGQPPAPTAGALRSEPARASTTEGPAKEGAPKPAVSTALPPAPASDDLDRLRSGWSTIVASVRPATRALIAECRPLAVDGNVVTLGFPEAKAFLKDVAERKSADLEAAVGGHLGRVVAVRCVATNLDLVPALPEDEDAARVLEEARRIFAEDLADVREVG